MPNEVCSKCHEDFMNCKCEQFHPNMKLDVVVYCNDCELNNNDEAREMGLEGPLYFNPKTKTQSQGYKCPDCGHEVSVLIYPI